MNIYSGRGLFYSPLGPGIDIHITPEFVFTSRRNGPFTSPESALTIRVLRSPPEGTRRDEPAGPTAHPLQQGKTVSTGRLRIVFDEVFYLSPFVVYGLNSNLFDQCGASADISWGQLITTVRSRAFVGVVLPIARILPPSRATS